MKKNYFLLALIIYYVMGTVCVSAIESKVIDDYNVNSSVMIDLEGPGSGGGEPILKAAVASFSITNDIITAELKKGENIDVKFSANLGIIYIVIKDEAGTIRYSRSLNATADTKVIVPISQLTSGKYTITFSEVGGDLIRYGKFDIE